MVGKFTFFSKQQLPLLDESNRETSKFNDQSYGTIFDVTETREDNDGESSAQGGSKGDCIGRESNDIKIDQTQHLGLWEIVSILSTAFAYGCIMTTLFLITLPVECQRIQHEHPTIQKSISLAVFVAIAGVTQLVTPLIGMLSDMYQPPLPTVGKRLPYLVFGSILTVIGLLGQGISSAWSFWVRYSFFFFLHMVGLNIIYAMMIALIPDQVPPAQVGVANGSLAFLLVTGSLFGFGLFYSVLGEDIESMYALYTIIVIASSILTCSCAHKRDVTLMRTKSDVDLLSTAIDESQIPGLGMLVNSMIIAPLQHLDGAKLIGAFTIDTVKYHDFFVVTVSRTFYYMGISVQSFFLFFIHDVLHIRANPENAVALLSILGQCAGALICYPVGYASDKLFGGSRKPFIYVACVILASTTFSIMFMTSLDQMIFACLVLGGANGMYLTMDTSLAVDTLAEDQEDEGSNAQLLGVWGVAGFVGSALGPLVGGPLLYIFGNPVEESDGTIEYSAHGYAIVLGMSAIYYVCSALTLTLIRSKYM